MNEQSKVCSGCGALPTDDSAVNYCVYCGEKLITRSELPKDIWKDPQVKEALKEGRAMTDIAVLRCPECDEFGYYNEGSTFSCRFCDLTFLVMCEDESVPKGFRTVSANEVIQLDDTITKCTDGYDNRTL